MPNRPRNVLTDAQIAGAAKAAGFSGDALVKAVAIALAESSGDANAHNPRPPDNSYGLWQINMLGEMGPDRRKQFGLKSNEELFSPNVNAKAAYAISNGGKNFRPWSTYIFGNYLSYMPRARKAAGNPDSSGGTSNVQPAGFTDVFSWPGEILDFFEFVTDPNTWLRLGMILAGGVALMWALFSISGQVDKAKKLVDTATNIIPQTRAVKGVAAAAKAA